MLAEPKSHPILAEIAERAARLGGKTLNAWSGRFTTHLKAPRDLVTDADKASQTAIREMLYEARPGDCFLGEESEQPPSPPAGDEVCWVVDPLDGTANYVHGFPCYAVSVAAVVAGRVVAGAIYDPLRDELFRASLGGGAQLNGEPIRVSTTRALAEALVAVSLPPSVSVESRDVTHLLNILGHCRAVRRTGSAALNLAYVACGRLDAHWAHEIHPWDAAAGVLLVAEAGGVVTGSDASPYDVWRAHYLVASSQPLHEEIAGRMVAP